MIGIFFINANKKIKIIILVIYLLMFFYITQNYNEIMLENYYHLKIRLFLCFFILTLILTKKIKQNGLIIYLLLFSLFWSFSYNPFLYHENRMSVEQSDEIFNEVK
jgi:hypothetical protein